MISRIAALALAAAFAVACGGPQEPDFSVPPTAESALEILGSDWTVYRYDGGIDGSISFFGGGVSSVSGDVTYRGTWEHVESDHNLHIIELEFTEAVQDGVREQFAVSTFVELHLIFADREHLYALEPSGVWTLWERIIPDDRPDDGGEE